MKEQKKKVEKMVFLKKKKKKTKMKMIKMKYLQDFPDFPGNHRFSVIKQINSFKVLLQIILTFLSFCISDS